MKKPAIMAAAVIFLGLTLVCAPAFASSVIYSQPYDGSGNLFASQNDTNSGGFGNFATAYDNFKLLGNPAGWSITDVHWTGGYFNGTGNPPNPSGFTVVFYDDNGGIPGNAFASFSIGPNYNEDCTGYPICTYSTNLIQSVAAADNTWYWLSIEPDLGFPPQWGWATSALGLNDGYQCFFGSCGGVGVNFAFDITGDPVSNPTPEPGTLAMLGTGILGLAGVARRKLNL